MNSISTLIVGGATFAQLRNLNNEVIETVDADHPISNDGAVEFKREGKVPGITVTIRQVASNIGLISFEVTEWRLNVCSDQAQIVTATRLGNCIRLQRNQPTAPNASLWRIVCA